MGNNVVSVMLWGEEVGKLYWDERNKRDEKQKFNIEENVKIVAS